MPLVLITGCDGFLGKALAREYRVIGLDHDAPERIGPLAEFVPLDLASDSSVEEALEHVGETHGRKVASVIHLAAYYDFSGEPSPSLGMLIHGEEWATTTIPKAIAKAGAWVEEHVPGEDPFIKPWMIDLADDHFELDVTRAQATLGWCPERDLRSELRTMVESLRNDPARFYRVNELEPPGWLQRAAEVPSAERASHAG